MRGKRAIANLIIIHSTTTIKWLVWNTKWQRLVNVAFINLRQGLNHYGLLDGFFINNLNWLCGSCLIVLRASQIILKEQIARLSGFFVS